MDFIEHLLDLGPVVARSSWSRWPGPSCWNAAPDGGPRSATPRTVTLEPLPPEPMRELLHGLAPGLPDEAVKAIVDRSEGIPLYAVETVRMLLDTAQLRQEGDAYVLAGPLTDLQVPETLRALVAARLDANDPPDRALLTDAAVLGQSFTLAGLAGMTGRGEADLEAALDRLVRRELLLRDDDPRSPERGQYRFLQAVVREVAYDSLAKKDRRAKHVAAARHLESLGRRGVGRGPRQPLRRGLSRLGRRVRRRTPSPRRRGSRCARPRTGRRRFIRTPARSSTSTTP